MTQNSPNGLQINFSGLGCWLTLLAGAWLLGTAGLAWLVKSALILFTIVAIAPVIAFVGLRLWIKRKLVQGTCPVCEQPLTGLMAVQTPCPNCGTPLKATPDGFERATPEGTIEVQAVEVEAQAVETQANPSGVQTLDVEAKQLPEADNS